MIVHGEIRTGLYFDSVTLMMVGRDLMALECVADAAAVMATLQNQAILRASGLWIDAFETAGDTDLILAVKAETAEAAEAALKAAGARLQQARTRHQGDEQQLPGSVESAVRALPGANVALISVAGRYAAEQARQALEAGLHVMLFSDNVSLDSEIELKNLAREKGLLLMGPDCGTAILNGVPLAFANAVNRGDIGIVAAAGTGLQEVSTPHSQPGRGRLAGHRHRRPRHQAGSRRHHVPGSPRRPARRPRNARHRAHLQASPRDRAAAASGRPSPGSASRSSPPSWGPSEATVRQYGITPAATLEEAALMAAALSKCHHPEAARKFLEARRSEIHDAAVREAARFTGPRKYIRGLFSGGTFCAEAQLIFRATPSATSSQTCRWRPSRRSPMCGRARRTPSSILGDDAFTVGRPHPMIDYSLRNRRIAEEAGDPETAVILLDVVLGYGAHPDPAGELVPVIAAAPERVAFVCSITGTPQDPQDRRRVETALLAAGVQVFPSNAAAAEFAAQIAVALGGC